MGKRVASPKQNSDDRLKELEMSLIDNELKRVWDQLRGDKPHRQTFLEEIAIRNLRGITDLRVPLEFPVTVLAGENACGKSTVLFGCACAYKMPGAGSKNYVPTALFPSFTVGKMDAMNKTELEYAYRDNGRRMNMVWRRGKAWNRSFFGRKGATQPERTVYLRTLSNFTNPSAVRSMLQIKRLNHTIDKVNPGLLVLAKRILPFDYEYVQQAKKSRRRGDLLLTELKNGGAYSEFHMASGERSVFRMSMEISSLTNALVLIDEVETGLHPYIQKQLMLHLQRLSLREKLQIIVTTHSPVVLDSVPMEGRVFLRRDERHDVKVEVPLRDILQRAMYGQSKDKLSVLCEDDIAEFMIRGVVDALSQKIDLRPEDLFIGKNTGKHEFPAHARTLARIQQLQNFVFVLDGDARNLERPIRRAAQNVNILFLPGESHPEEWLWNAIKENTSEYGALLAIGQAQLENTMQEAESILSGATTSESERQKGQLQFLAERLQKHETEIARLVARQNTEERGEIIDFATDLEDEIRDWRNLLSQ